MLIAGSVESLKCIGSLTIADHRPIAEKCFLIISGSNFSDPLMMMGMMIIIILRMIMLMMMMMIMIMIMITIIMIMIIIIMIMIMMIIVIRYFVRKPRLHNGSFYGVLKNNKYKFKKEKYKINIKRGNHIN